MTGGREPTDRPADDFDQVERMTRVFARWGRMALIVGAPVWLVLLVVVPGSGLGPMASLSLSTLLAGAVVVAAERLRLARAGRTAARSEGDGPASAAARRPMSASRAVLLTLAGAVAVVYVLFALVMIARGG